MQARSKAVLLAIAVLALGASAALLLARLAPSGLSSAGTPTISEDGRPSAAQRRTGRCDRTGVHLPAGSGTSRNIHLAAKR